MPCSSLRVLLGGAVVVWEVPGGEGLGGFAESGACVAWACVGGEVVAWGGLLVGAACGAEAWGGSVVCVGSASAALWGWVEAVDREAAGVGRGGLAEGRCRGWGFVVEVW